MDTQFKAEFVDGRIRCFLTLGQPTENAVFCFSLMGPGSVLSGGNLVKRVGGFHEVQLPPLAEREVHSVDLIYDCLLYTSPSPRDRTRSRMPSSA